MIERNLASAVISATLLTACAATKPPPPPPHPEVISAIRRIETVAVLPPTVEYTRIAFSGENERVTSVEQNVFSSLTGTLEEVVGTRQYVVRKIEEGPAEEQKREMQFEQQQLEAALTAAFKQAAESEPENKETRPRVSIGAAASPLAHRLNADALLVTRYSGFQKTGGQRTKEAMSGILMGALTGVVRISASEGGAVIAVLVDGPTGEVLWMGRGTHATFQRAMAPGTYKGPTSAAGAARQALSSFPTREAAAKPQ